MSVRCDNPRPSVVAPPPLLPAQFLEDFPEFANSPNFPNSSIQFWITAAGLLLNAQRFGSMLNLATELFVAHNIALEALNRLGGAAGIPGLSRGAISSESAGAVSASYDTGSALVDGAGHWNLTNYGTRFKWLVNMFGAGPIQVGPGCALPGLWNAFSGGFIFGPGWYVDGNTSDFEGNL